MELPEHETEFTAKSQQLGWTVRLPFLNGTVVYHKMRKDKVKGIVCGYTINSGSLLVHVTWGGETLVDLRHYPFELTTIYEPDYVD